MEFKVGDKVILSKKGLQLYGDRGELAKGVTVTYVGQGRDGPFVGWSKNCGGCYNHYLQLMEGPW